MRTVWTLIRREVFDILRDRKTLVMMIVVPILLYPLIIIGMSLLFSMFLHSQEEKTHIVAYPESCAAFAEELKGSYMQGEQEFSFDFVQATAGGEEQAREEADVWLEASQDENGVYHAELFYHSASESSSSAQMALEGLLEDYREELLEKNLREKGLDEDFLRPLVYESRDESPVSESFGMDVGGSIGMILITTILLGAVYPAIDATAGEKERGTLETLLTLPVTNFQMLLGKYISVAFFACVTALLSLLSLGGSVLFLMYGLSPELAEEMSAISFSAIAARLPLFLAILFVTALLVTALCMCFCLFARSFKEANNYVMPVMLVVMFASMAAIFPSVQLDYRTALIPFVNVSLLVRQALAQQFSAPLAGLTLLVNLAYSAVTVWILARLYDSEDILFSDGFRGVRLFQKRSEIRRGSVPGLGDLVVTVALLLLLTLYAVSAVTVRSALIGLVAEQLLILLLPLGVAWYMKSDMRTLFSLRKPSARICVSAVILYIGVYLLMLAIGAVLVQLLPASAQNLGQSFDPLTEYPAAALFLIIAVMPAVAEELLFRGFLFGSLRENFRRRKHGCVFAAVLSGLVFAAFHMSLVKLIPTFLLGAAFACIVWRGGSIFVTMALHFLNNVISVAALKYPRQMERLLPFLMKETFSAAELSAMLAAGLALACAGLLLLRRWDRTKSGTENS